MQAIELENVVRIYKIGEVETRALDGVSLSIEPGEFTTLVGPSGSGKTTMLQLMGCLDKPNSGAVKIDNQDVTIGHEASVSKVGEEQLFYLMSRGLSEEEATTMIVSGFIEPLVKELLMEYAIEMNRLIQLQMEGSIG